MYAHLKQFASPGTEALKTNKVIKSSVVYILKVLKILSQDKRTYPIQMKRNIIGLYFLLDGKG